MLNDIPAGTVCHFAEQVDTVSAAGNNFELWFENNSLSGGQAIVFQPTSNVQLMGGNIQQLAWMVKGANPATQVKFTWSIDYGFLWIDRSINQSSGSATANVGTGSTVTFSSNQYGFYFATPASGTARSLMIVEDESIPPRNKAVAGISMNNGGIFAAPAAPNTKLTYSPVQTAQLQYNISFGMYNVQVGDTIIQTDLNEAGVIGFAPGAMAMTATLDTTNGWTITQGPPASIASNYLTAWPMSVVVARAASSRNSSTSEERAER